ncbi:Ureidoglycolate lyase [Bacillus sp. THAF10]|uniref:fumarylacetoacetate hydrolase family protein n=1 Tax=Bacillus sp. THAF10 TaxID=2587848 RepID=UPI0012694A6C|nr:fumarylacetoacetate hydrolase family protein [Bacillus sp. THAF10]QFT89199.1 Ureidoglycolate lyase [Bacillus sp. THAF10]
MKYVTFINTSGDCRLGMIKENFIIDLHEATNGRVPKDMQSFIEAYDTYQDEIKRIYSEPHLTKSYPFDTVTLLAPLPRPVSIRDFYAFEEHVKTARSRRGLDVVPEWYDIPVFYFTNHLAVRGPEEVIDIPPGCERLDFELEIACIIGKEGKNIRAEDAEEYIFGYCIMNDWSARDLQAQEMKVGLGPAKGKDFATSLGPCMVTKDELEPYKTSKGYNLKMTASVNGKQISEGNFASIYYSFAEMIERASSGVTLYPGEVIGSGTVGTGCILELGTETHRWLRSKDEIALSITELGTLKNTIK